MRLPWVFEESNLLAGYALYRREPDWVYLRQFYVQPEFRRRGIGRGAMAWLLANAWQETPRIRLDVLHGNTAGHAFWQSVGFHDYCITMERET